MKTTKRYNPNAFNALHAATAYLTYWLMMVSVAFLLSFIMYSGDGAAEDMAPYLCLESIFIAAGLALVTLIFCLAAKVRPINGGGFLSRKGCGVEKLMAGVLIVGMASLFSPLANDFAFQVENIQVLLNFPAASGGGGTVRESGLLVLYVLILVPLLPAIFEELLFRGVILKGFLQFGKVPAVVLSALLFALAHGNPQQLIYQFLVGLAIGMLVVETRNIVVGMVAHFANNFFASWGQLVYGFVSEKYNVEVYNSIIQIMTYLIGAVCLVAGLIYFGKRMLHSQKCPEKARGDVTATFVVNDMVAGTLLAEKPWYECGALAERDAEPQVWLADGSGRGKLNKKAKILPTAILIALGLAAAIAVGLVALIGIA